MRENPVRWCDERNGHGSMQPLRVDGRQWMDDVFYISEVAGHLLPSNNLDQSVIPPDLLGLKGRIAGLGEIARLEEEREEQGDGGKSSRQRDAEKGAGLRGELYS